ENKQRSVKKFKKKSSDKKYFTAENTEITVFKKQIIKQQMNIIKSVNNYNIKILSFSIKNETL
ncbi:hypothetical protein EMPG_09548, partial [Blastomyces silverae]